MENVSDLRVSELASSRYVRPYRLHFERDGHSLSWDYILSHDSLAVLLLNTSRDVFIFVKQFRPAVLMHLVHQHIANDGSSSSTASTVASGLTDQTAGDGPAETPAGNGVQQARAPAGQLHFPQSPVDPARACCYELCAGLIDKSGKSLPEIAREEVLEECGYDVPLSRVHRVTSYQSNVGVGGSRQVLFFAEVTDEMKTGKGGGLESEGELIEVIEVPRDHVMEFIMDESKPKATSVLFAVSLFLSSPGFFRGD
ncbi:uridine diphosphate glucose pyrophosphatase NUDT14-like [Sycon ciliatum]|uniref:uridine diphosphate glucose pyrophosphatase NUDT14-like n=1 Tax=Sycon ciliatum TaxID=27933 RepID=UPI0020AD8AF3|eukprot:scpid90807/ scgid20105/ Uridine diphosphate glucose pyrophosphatase; Nucleoside diphosphate-linked moiety X motif 14